MIQVRAVIVNHNTAALTERCIRDLDRQLGVQVEVIVVDAFSRADEYDSLCRRVVGRAATYRCEQPAGYSTCLNIGMKAAGGVQPDYYLLMNSDVAFDNPRTLASLVAGIRSSPAFVAASPLIREARSTSSPESSEQVRNVPGYWDLVVTNSWLLRRMPLLRQVHQELWYGSQRPFRRNSVYPCGTVNGAMFLVTREHMEATGYLDEGVFLYMEEAIFGHEARRMGKMCCLVTQSVVNHLQGEATGYTVRSSFNGSMFDRFTESECHYIRRYLNGGLAGVAFLRIVRAADKLGMRLLWNWHVRRKYQRRFSNSLGDAI